MTNHHVVADLQRHAVTAVQHDVVLNANPSSDSDRGHVPPNGDERPDVGAWPELHVAHDHRRLRHEDPAQVDQASPPPGQERARNDTACPSVLDSGGPSANAAWIGASDSDGSGRGNMTINTSTLNRTDGVTGGIAVGG